MPKANLVSAVDGSTVEVEAAFFAVQRMADGVVLLAIDKNNEEVGRYMVRPAHAADAPNEAYFTSLSVEDVDGNEVETGVAGEVAVDPDVQDKGQRDANAQALTDQVVAVLGDQLDAGLLQRVKDAIGAPADTKSQTAAKAQELLVGKIPPELMKEVQGALTAPAEVAEVKP